MHKVLILSRDADEYGRLISAADLPELELTADPAQSDIVLGEPKLIRDKLPALSRL